jgi:serine/threonine-protein kinase
VTGSDGNRAVTVPVVITRAESLAIAAAIQKRLASGRPTGKSADSTAVAGAAAEHGPRIVVRSLDASKTDVAFDRDALLAEVRRIFTDSMAQAMARMEKDMSSLPRDARFDPSRGAPAGMVPLIAPPADGRTRVVISNFTNATGKREFGAVGRDAAAFLRSALPADKYDVIDNATTDRASRLGTDRLSLGWGLRADFVITGVVSQRLDSLVLMTIFTDVRSGRFSRAYESAALPPDAKRTFDPALVHVKAWLDSAKTLAARAGGRGRSGPPPNGPPPNGPAGLLPRDAGAQPPFPPSINVPPAKPPI